MRQKLKGLAIITVLLSQLACAFFTGITGPSSPRDGSGIYSQPGTPLNVALTPDSARATEVISPAGGTLSVTGSDGTRYTLAVPAGALPTEAEISLIPIASISGLPFSGGLGGAVQLEPSGLSFYQFVTLTIEPANPIPLEKQVVFGFEEDGQDLHLALPGEDSRQIQVRLLHFSGAGVASGISEEKAGVMRRLANRAEVRLTAEMAQHLQDLRSGKNPDPKAVEASFTEFYNSVVIPRLKAATSASATCAEAQAAIQTFLDWERQRQLLGPGTDAAKFEKVVSDYFPTLTKKCLDEEFDRCANKHQIAGMLPTLLGFERLGQLVGAFSASEPDKEDPAWVKIRDYGETLVRKCYQWDLEFESAGAYDAGEVGFDSRVKAVVPIRLQGEVLNLNLTGQAALENLAFNFKYEASAGELCQNQSFPGGGEFTAHSLGWVPELRQAPDGQMRYFVKDFSLRYDPGLTSESYLLDCVDTKDQSASIHYQSAPTPHWSATYLVTHYTETAEGGGAPAQSFDELVENGLSGNTLYLANAWQVAEAERMATKEWQGASDLEPAVFEGGGFTLYHRPQP